MENPSGSSKLRRKAPQLIILTIALAIAAIILLEIFEDVLVGGAPASGPLSDLINGVVFFMANVTAAVKSWGYVSVFVLMLLESSSLPIPSEVVLPFAGYLVSLGQLNFWVTLAVATLAGIGGSLIDYYIGLRGAHVLAEHRVLGKVLFSKHQLEVAAGWFSKYGIATVFIARLVPGLRTIVSFPAGAVRMSLIKFVIFTTAGCLLWNALIIYVGVFLGDQWRAVAGVSHYLIIGVVIAVVVAGMVFLVLRRKRLRTSAIKKLG